MTRQVLGNGNYILVVEVPEVSRQALEMELWSESR